MSRKPSFANLRGTATPTPAVAPAPRVKATPAPAPVATSAPPEPAPVSTRPVSREGRKQIAGFFSPDMSLAMHMLARRQGRSLQALMAEAFNDVLRKHGESPIGD
ncbi:ribbon-helix-helix domain-containing protein [Sphingomonas phyllosphaerae]|uniref:ribbon-helix-helix domain-containing protein n=1 Tax=Sphingomonas phyllosphaerae TaxID=257003 RepID=UPI0004147AAD|nr:ribbon-helix-helix domain-containing protein [Sphingomonas phyllosphaerae]